MGQRNRGLLAHLPPRAWGDPGGTGWQLLPCAVMTRLPAAPGLTRARLARAMDGQGCAEEQCPAGGAADPALHPHFGLGRAPGEPADGEPGKRGTGGAAAAAGRLGLPRPGRLVGAGLCAGGPDAQSTAHQGQAGLPGAPSGLRAVQVWRPRPCPCTPRGSAPTPRAGEAPCSCRGDPPLGQHVLRAGTLFTDQRRLGGVPGVRPGAAILGAKPAPGAGVRSGARPQQAGKAARPPGAARAVPGALPLARRCSSAATGLDRPRCSAAVGAARRAPAGWGAQGRGTVRCVSLGTRASCQTLSRLPSDGGSAAPCGLWGASGTPGGCPCRGVYAPSLSCPGQPGRPWGTEQLSPGRRGRPGSVSRALNWALGNAASDPRP